MDNDLTAFISARLDEDEMRHRHAGEGRIAWLTYRLDNGDLSHTTVAADHHDGHWCADGKLLPEPASVLTVYDQSQALREIAAKRKRLATYIKAQAAADKYGDDKYMVGLAHGLADAVKDDAAVWSDHPDYQAAWAL